MGTFFQTCAPYFVGHLFVYIVTVVAADLVIKKLGPVKGWPSRRTLIAIAALLSIGFSINNVTNQLINNALVARSRQPQAPIEAPTASAAAPKADFLLEVDRLLAHPDQITPESKLKLFANSSVLFPRGTSDKEGYRAEISDLLACQAAFYEDAIVALNSKHPEKSPRRDLCQQKPGAFFEREKLVSPDVAKIDDETIAALALGKPIIQDGKEIKVDETLLRQRLQDLRRRQDDLKRLFE